MIVDFQLITALKSQLMVDCYQSLPLLPRRYVVSEGMGNVIELRMVSANYACMSAPHRLADWKINTETSIPRLPLVYWTGCYFTAEGCVSTKGIVLTSCKAKLCTTNFNGCNVLLF